jgi:diguanylate cyclase (GGDEF)-like protein
MRRWALWDQPRRFVVYLLLIELATVSTTTIAGLTSSTKSHDLQIFGVLIGFAVVQTELSRRVERVRRRINAALHTNMTSVWTFAAAMVLPPLLIALLVVVLYTDLAARSWYRLRGISIYRTVGNASIATLTVLIVHGTLVLTGFNGVASATHDRWAGFLQITVGAVTYFVINAVIIIPLLDLHSTSFKEVFGSVADNFLEFSTLCLGAITGVLIVEIPQLTAAILPPMLLLHRGVLVTQLEVAATTDEKTGVFNTTGWHQNATRELIRASRTSEYSIGLLMIDLDHFKRVNDEHGHLAGDEVLKAVAGTITEQVRDDDSVGRFGGEEFVVLLPNTAEPAVCAVAERIRQAIAAIQVEVTRTETSVVIAELSVSIGVAMHPSAGDGLDDLIHAADTALYIAKHEGRNRVVRFPSVA